MGLLGNSFRHQRNRFSFGLNCGLSRCSKTQGRFISKW